MVIRENKLIADKFNEYFGNVGNHEKEITDIVHKYIYKKNQSDWNSYF